MRVRLLRWLRAHPLANFVLMGACFLGFGLISFNLVLLLSANLELFREHGWQVVQDGAAAQLLSLLAQAYLGLACFVGFKVCEKLLVEQLASLTAAPPDAR
jgi:hypothetical protein